MTVKVSTSPYHTSSWNTHDIREGLTKMVKERLQVKKLKEIGDGCYAIIFQHPHDDSLVIKIALSSPNYSNYIVWCAENQDNPYVPRLESVEIFDVHSNSTYCKNAAIVVMEKLRRVGNTGRSYDDMVNYLSSGSCPDRLRSLETFPKLEMLRNKLKRRGSGMPDLHTGNFMKRGAQYVVTDPVIG